MEKFENIHQIGGLRLIELADGPGKGNRLIEVNTGSPLRYDIAVDRGADLVGAFYGQHSLCYLTPNGIKRPSRFLTSGQLARQRQEEHLTTCGPVTMGSPRTKTGDTGLTAASNMQPS